MIKLGEKRINPNNIIKYYPELENSIKFELVNGKSESIFFRHQQERDEMLKMLDDYLVFFDNGILKGIRDQNLPSFIINDTDKGYGPGGIPMQ